LPTRIRYRQVPSSRNPLWVKGAGEAGTVGAAPALVDAGLDALAPRGIGHGHAACTVEGALLNSAKGGILPHKKAAPEGAALPSTVQEP
jgi:hypothetical protein